MTNSFKGPKEEFDDINTNVRIEKRAKSPSIFVAKIHNFSSFLQLNEIKMANNEQIKIQPKSSMAYINIVKKLKSRKNAEFHTYKPK
jgi:hypothetical protein